MKWIPFQSEQDIPAFIDAAVELHRPLFDRLPLHQRPFFFDHWLGRFNHSQSFLLEHNNQPRALLTVPRCEDIHSLRWQYRTFACSENLPEPLTLPPEVNLDRSFLMPCQHGETLTHSPFANTTHQPVQLGYVQPLPESTENPPHPCRFRAATPSDFNPIIDLLQIAYADFADFDPNLTRQREELRQIFTHQAGWCYCATLPGDPHLLAVVSYIALPLPLLGVPAALVADLAVAPDSRGQHLAPTLQQYAFPKLHAAGLRWLYGNIDPPNPASRRQAEATGRTIWYHAIRFTANTNS